MFSSTLREQMKLHRRMLRERQVLLACIRAATRQYGHAHWDATGGHGAGCPACVQQRATRARIDRALERLGLR